LAISGAAGRNAAFQFRSSLRVQIIGAGVGRGRRSDQVPDTACTDITCVPHRPVTLARSARRRGASHRRV
jgi:hypothetical protein